MNPVSANNARFLLGASIVLASCAQLLFRISMTQSGNSPDGAGYQLVALVHSLSAGDGLLLAFGLLCYAASMIAWIPVLSRIDVSVAYPMAALSYVLVYACAIYLPWLQETPSTLKSAGILTILIGVWIVAASSSSIPDRQSSD